MLNKDLEAAPKGTAYILEVFNLSKKYSNYDYSKSFEDFRKKIEDVPETILHVALDIYSKKLALDQKHIHPNYFINTALMIKRKQSISRWKKKDQDPEVSETTSAEVGLSLGRAI